MATTTTRHTRAAQLDFTATDVPEIPHSFASSITGSLSTIGPQNERRRSDRRSSCCGTLRRRRCALTVNMRLYCFSGVGSAIREDDAFLAGEQLDGALPLGDGEVVKVDIEYGAIVVGRVHVRGGRRQSARISNPKVAGRRDRRGRNSAGGGPPRRGLWLGRHPLGTSTAMTARDRPRRWSRTRLAGRRRGAATPVSGTSTSACMRQVRSAVGTPNVATITGPNVGNSTTRKERDSGGQRLHGCRRRCRQGRTTTVGNDEGYGRGQWCNYVVDETAIEEKDSDVEQRPRRDNGDRQGGATSGKGLEQRADGWQRWEGVEDGTTATEEGRKIGGQWIAAATGSGEERKKGRQ
ncbi:hypothetical protein BHE74_00016969 [Ensete ventricosum]|nr:hypothetical protein BHE74_00016969 [Ensete ventricosum]